jgi:hypothetical protein
MGNSFLIFSLSFCCGIIIGAAFRVQATLSDVYSLVPFGVSRFSLYIGFALRTLFAVLNLCAIVMVFRMIRQSDEKMVAVSLVVIGIFALLFITRSSSRNLSRKLRPILLPVSARDGA